MRNLILVILFLGGSIALADDTKMHTSVGSYCDEPTAQEFTKLFPQINPAEFCYTLCLNFDRDHSLKPACFPIPERSAREAKNTFNGILLSLREDGQVKLVAKMAQSSANIFEFRRALNSLVPMACNAALDNVRVAQFQLSRLSSKDPGRLAAEVALKREQKYLGILRTYYPCKPQEI